MSNSLDLHSLTARWHTHDPAAWSGGQYAELAERMLEHGEPLLAYDVVAEGLARHADDTSLRTVMARALMLSGDCPRALKLLEGLPSSPERCDLQAELHLQLALDNGRREHFEAAYDLYRTRHPVRAAVTAQLLGRRVMAERGDDDPLLAGWAAMLHAKWDEAADSLRRARATPHTRRLTRRLLTALGGPDANWLEACLPVPPIATVSGHMIDRADRPEPRFPHRKKRA